MKFIFEITKGEGCVVKHQYFETLEEALLELRWLRKITNNKVSLSWKIEGQTYSA